MYTQPKTILQKTNIFCFRNDLRISDNPALYKAVEEGKCILVCILDDKAAGKFKMGAASKCWLHHSLVKLNESLDGKLNIYQGDTPDILLDLVKRHAVDSIYFNIRYEPWGIKQDSELKQKLEEHNISCKTFDAVTLWNPKDVLKSNGEYYKVFTPFYRRGCFNAKPPRFPIPKPSKMNCIKDKGSLKIEQLKLLPDAKNECEKWHENMMQNWQVGEDAAQHRLLSFMENELNHYKNGRDFPSYDNVSRLSPHLHFGEISPNQIWYKIYQKGVELGGAIQDVNSDHFLSELGWREFSYYLLYNFPNLPTDNFQPKFDKLRWRDCEGNKDAIKLLRAWQKGLTGYPIVDAGMRELWQTGYMHNRVRMIVGSFLVKNLMIHWKHGEAWFWDCLVDADLANNSAGWQWIAGSGADAAPYFRIFNPITQGEKFDAEGVYTRRFVPELSNLPNNYLFKPWEAPKEVLKDAGVILGTDYPKPIIDLRISRQLALDEFAKLCKQNLS